MRALVFLGSLSLALAAPLPAQGSDACALPDVVSGLGPHAFDNGAATIDVSDLSCAPIGRDVWFTWTAPSTATVSLSTCGPTVVDTVLAVYAGAACPGSAALACNDDACGRQSTVTFAATSGASYVVRIGSFADTPGGTGTFLFASNVPCAVVSGPDLIVGDVSGPSNYTAAGGLDAISLGVATCNVGTVWANWFSNTNQHPVIGGNLYRYRVVAGSGRFEQIGMSWLLHGFFALSQVLCCTSCTGTNGEHLGVGCADPSTASRTGSQPGLGPRWQVNASAGTCAYPPANPGFSGSTARRLQFLQSDVDVSPGVRYFGEVHVVSPDEAAAGNHDNNASHRELTTNGNEFTFVAPTQRLAPAIEAWAACEPGVSITKARVPNEGHFDVASKVTYLGGGQYHYEYAVHNLNCHRSGGSFSIPIGTAAITNVGFRDVEYRNGDGESNVNFSGLDWSSAISGNVLTWTTQPQSIDPNANALRWGTTYNFRFDADAPATDGTALLGLWRPGTPTTVDAITNVPDASSSVPFCTGDGSGTPCPCANNGTAGNGCANSIFAEGASLVTLGAASIAADTLVLGGSAMPNAAALYFQGTQQIFAGAGTPFGDGKRCAGGTVIRLGTKINASGASQYPVGADVPISIRGAVAANDVRLYQVWYRNAAAFCTADTFNLTNGRRVVWAP